MKNNHSKEHIYEEVENRIEIAPSPHEFHETLQNELMVNNVAYSCREDIHVKDCEAHGIHGSQTNTV